MSAQANVARGAGEGAPLRQVSFSDPQVTIERKDDGSGVLFTSSHGGAMHRATSFRIWRECATRAGLPSEKRHPHCAKHTLGSLLGRAGASAFHIQRALGHASITATQVYTALDFQHLARVYDQAHPRAKKRD